MLECWVSTSEEASKVAVDGPIRFSPVLYEYGIDANLFWVRICLEMSLQVAIPFEDRLPKAAALFPWTSMLSESVNGIRTSNTPRLSRWAFNSSLRAKTAMAAVISDWTLSGTSSTSCLHFCTAPASRTSCLFLSELAARFRSVEMAWH